MDQTADEFTPSGIPWREAEKRAGSLDVLRPYLHLGQIRARHGGLLVWPEGQQRRGPGEIRLEWWARAYEDRAGRMMFFIESAFWPESGVVVEQLFAYAASIELDRAAFERCFPAATGPAEPDGRRAAQESTLEQNAETASSASATAPPAASQIEPVLPAPPKIAPQAWFRKALEKDHPRQQDEPLIDYARRLYPLMQAANLTKPWTFETLRRRLDDKPDDKPAKPAPKARHPTGTR